MKIYFSSSLRAKRLYKKNFKLIYQYIKDLGHSHTSHFLVKTDPDKFYKKKDKDFAVLYRNLHNQIKKADVCIFEVSLHSLGVGYSVNLALEMGKPVIILYLKGKDTVLFKGIKPSKLQSYEYELKDLKQVLKDALEVTKNLIDIRFTFFITPKIVHFLRYISHKKRIPRAVYLRNLLKQAMIAEDFKNS